MKILFIGDLVGGLGIKAFKSVYAELASQHGIDFCVVNAENSAGGFGITGVIAKDLYQTGVDVITTGNHVWSRKEILNHIDSDPRMVRPANFHPDIPGRGAVTYTKNNMTIGVINLIGRLFMDPVDSPFTAADREIEELKKSTRVIIVDFHAEATSEKNCMGWYLDGRVSAVIGTHTHVQTADEKILPCGTAYLTDAGMTGPYDGIIGVNRDTATDKFLKNLNDRMLPATGRGVVNGAVLDVDPVTGKTNSIQRIFRVLEEVPGA